MKKIFLILFILFTQIVAVKAAGNINANDLFTQANQAFEKGDLPKAEEIYTSLISQGFESTELYYNLGNLEYRKGERGKAVLWYERAARLSPRDSDVQFNLSLARSHIKDDDSNLLVKLLSYATVNELGWFMTFLIWIFFGVLSATFMGWIKNETGASATLWLSGFFLVAVGAWFGAGVAMAKEPMAIVINPPGEVRNGPGNDYAVGFTIPEGSKVVVLNRRPDWTQVGVTSQGLKGWMPNSDIQDISLAPSLN